MIEIYGIGGFILLVLNVWAIVSIVGSAASTGGKVLWVILILLLPVLGFIIWLIAGPRGAARTA
ncbi:MAG: PLDc N-terminal domain-containing protein [Pseudomonadota bacterium]